MRIVVPIKPLSQAKSRLATVLSAIERADVMRGLLDRVILAACDVAPVTVVTADIDVAARAQTLGAEVIEEREVMGLNAAARLGVARARSDRDAVVMILAADLPDVTSAALRGMIVRARPSALVIAPSRDGGTNAQILAPHLDFRFAYGPDSFARHRAEAERLGLEVVVHDAPALSMDIDRPEDLAVHRDLWAA